MDPGYPETTANQLQDRESKSDDRPRSRRWNHIPVNSWLEGDAILSNVCECVYI